MGGTMDRFARILAAAILVAAASLSRPARAATVRGDGRVVVPAGERVADDLYVFGGQVEVNGTVDGDLVVFGGQVDVTGRVDRDLFVAGGNVTVTGPIGGTVRIVGGNLVVRGDVGRDLLFAGGSLTVGAPVRIRGDLLVGSGQARVAGTVGRDLRVSAGDVILTGTVGRDLEGRVGQLTLARGATVKGDVRYTSTSDVERDPGATIGGSLVRIAPPPAERGAAPAALFVFKRLRRFLGALLLGLTLVLLFPWFSKKGLTKLGEKPLTDLGIGLAFTIGVPAAALLVAGIGWLLAGWWVGALVFGLYLLALGVGYVLAGAGLGRWILARLGQAGVHPALALLLGLAVLILLGTVPILGPAVAIVAVLFGTGALARAIGDAWKRHGTTAEAGA